MPVDEHAAAPAASAKARLADHLASHARYELLPFDGIEEKVAAHVPRDVKLTVTASPKRGIDRTIEVTENLAREGYRVVPHLSARLHRDAAHVRENVDRLLAAGVDEVFVIAGDAEVPSGEFEGALGLLTVLRDLGDPFPAVGISGYPESHHLISDDIGILSMYQKQSLAHYVISQICFDAKVIAKWIARVRDRGTFLPIWVGVPGSVSQQKLIRVSMTIGLGDSARFLSRHRSWLTGMALKPQYTPTRLMHALERRLRDPADVGGYHIYTFNELAATEQWRQALIARLRDGR